jgi:protein tyrosine/serine phosphatase
MKWRLTTGAASLELFETDFLVPLDTTLGHSIASQHPFIRVDGTLNFRDLGGLPIAGAPALQTRPGLIFRSGQISALTTSGKETLRGLGVRTVFDFRSSCEFKKYNAPIPSVLDIEILHVPVFDDKAFTPDEMARRHNLCGEGKEGFLGAYRDIMDHGGPVFAKVFRRVIARPQSPVLFHCAGVSTPE